MVNPIVSIITPSYNRADIVHETADSIFSQSYPHWEWVIVEDGSTDNSWEVLQQFASRDKRVKLFKRDREPKGACACRNIAVEKCSGEYVMFLDTDDLVAPYCLEQRVKAAQECENCDFIIFPMFLFRKEPDDMGVLWNIDGKEDEISRLLTGDPICQGTGTLWKKSSFARVGMWNEELLLWQDIELHLRSFLFPVTYQKRMDLLPDVYLRVSDVSLSRTAYHSLPKFKSRMKVFTNTIARMAVLNKIDHYRQGLRTMGGDLIVSAAKSGYFKEAATIATLCGEHGIFSEAEIGKFRTFVRFRSMRLNRIPYVDKYLQKKMDLLLPHLHNNVGKIKYSTPNQY